MRDGGYLTIEETARKLGRPVSWVKEQICEGQLGAVLSGRQWVIPPQEVDELLRNNPPPRGAAKVVHNFLPDRSSKETHGARNVQKISGPTRSNKVTERPRKSSPYAGNGRPEETKGTRPTLTQKIKELDRVFEQQTARLRAAMLRYRAATGSGKKAKPPTDLIHQWKTAKAELRHLVVKAEAKGLTLPTSLTIYKILAQEAGPVKQRTAPKGDAAKKQTKPPAKGIEGFSAGSSRGNPQEIRKVPAHAEAQLIVLRNRERAAAHSMQDRGKSRAAREAAAITWAEARREAEKLEREFRVIQRPV